VHYGGRTATAQRYRRLVELDGLCQAERPVALGAPR
jgi:hypothetical protein